MKHLYNILVILNLVGAAWAAWKLDYALAGFYVTIAIFWKLNLLEWHREAGR